MFCNHGKEDIKHTEVTLHVRNQDQNSTRVNFILPANGFAGVHPRLKKGK